MEIMKENEQNTPEQDIISTQSEKESVTTGSFEAQKAELLKGFSDYLNTQPELCKDNVNLLEMFPKFLALQNEKGRLYGRSYAKHGDLSIFFNLERKWDRIFNIMTNVMKNGMDSLHSESSSTPTETFMDTIVDLGMYCLMWAGYIRENYPEEYEKFIQSNKL